MTTTPSNPPAQCATSATPHTTLSPLSCWDELVSSLNAFKSRENFSHMKTYSLAVNPVIQVNEQIIALPLTDHGAEIIKHVSGYPGAENGSQVVTDTSNRRSWKLGVENFQLQNPEWNSFLETILKDVRKGLDIIESINAEPYQLLLCEQDALSQCQDGIKETAGTAAMVAIYLPSEHQGGVVRLSYADKYSTFDISTSSPFTTKALAWPADAIYEAGEMSSGRRLILIYRFVDKAAIQNSSANVGQPIDIVGQALERCVQQAPNFSPKMYMLDHKYPPSGLRLDSLKGHDKAAYEALHKLCPRHGLSLLLGRLVRRRTTLGRSDISNDTAESIFMVNLFNEDDQNIIAEEVVFAKDQLLRDEHRESRIGGITVTVQNSICTITDIAAIICPTAQLTFSLNPFALYSFENITSMVMRDIDNATDLPRRSKECLRVLDEIIDSQHHCRLSPNFVTGMIVWAWKKQYYNLSTKIISSEICFCRNHKTMNAVAHIINTDIAEDIDPSIIDWGKYFDSTIYHGPELRPIISSLVTMEANLRNDLKPSFRAWASTVGQHIFRAKKDLSMTDIKFFLAIIPKKEYADWVISCIVPALRIPQRRKLLREFVCEILNWNTEHLKNAKEVADTLILYTYKTAALEKVDFEDNLYSNSGASCFTGMIRICLTAGLKTAVIRLLDASWTNIAPYYENTVSLPLSISTRNIQEFLVDLGHLLRTNNYPYISSMREMFRLLVRRYIYSLVPPYPQKLPGWAHRARGCGCVICIDLDGFLASAQLSKRDFIMNNIDHLKSRLPRGLIRCVRRSTSDTGVSTYRLHKIKDKEFEQDVEAYFEEVSAVDKSLKMLRNDYMKGLFGEADYSELVLLHKVEHWEGQEQHEAETAAKGKKRKAEDLSDDGSEYKPAKK